MIFERYLCQDFFICDSHFECTQILKMYYSYNYNHEYYYLLISINITK